MADSRNVVRRTVETCLKRDGWTKSAESWYMRSENLLAIGLQKSNYANAYFLNLAIFVKPVESSFPREELAPIRLRVDKLPGAGGYSPRKLLDLETEIAESEREQNLIELMEQIVLPQMRNCATVRDLMPGGVGRSVLDAVPLLGAEALFLRDPESNSPHEIS